MTKKSKILLLIFSIIVLLATCVGMGFTEQIRETGFEPFMIFFVLLTLSSVGIAFSIALIGEES